MWFGVLEVLLITTVPEENLSIVTVVCKLKPGLFSKTLNHLEQRAISQAEKICIVNASDLREGPSSSLFGRVCHVGTFFVPVVFGY